MSENGTQHGKVTAMELVTQPQTPQAMRTEMAMIVPHSFSEAIKMSEMLCKSGLVPDELRDRPSNVLAIIMAGNEIGIPPMQAILNIDVVRGRPRLRSQLERALVLSSPACLYFRCVKSTEVEATYETQRKGSPKQTATFTMAMAERAGLTKPSPKGEPSMYTKYPERMLAARASQILTEEVYPDIIKGFRTSEDLPAIDADVVGEVVGDHAHEEPRPSAAPTQAVEAPIEAPKTEATKNEATRTEDGVIADGELVMALINEMTKTRVEAVNGTAVDPVAWKADMTRRLAGLKKSEKKTLLQHFTSTLEALEKNWSKKADEKDLF